jgi:hypothetical protein
MEWMETIDRASTMASSMGRAAAKSCPTLIVKAVGAARPRVALLTIVWQPRSRCQFRVVSCKNNDYYDDDDDGTCTVY